MPMDCNEACISPLTVTCDSGLDVLNPTDVCKLIYHKKLKTTTIVCNS